MNNAETALAEFAGDRAHTDATNAADILEKFIGHCNSMGGEGQACLKFQPKLASGMGNSVQQLLDSMSMGAGSNSGLGAGGGSSARRTSLANIGLYGSFPTRSDRASMGHGGRADHGFSTESKGATPDNMQPIAVGADGKTRTEAASDAAIPPQYRQQVGEYFQRVADELGEN